MNKISLIVAREYITRVRKKSFIVMTIIGPVLFAALIVLPGWFAQLEDKDVKQIAVVETDANGNPLPDSSQHFRNVIPDKANMKFIYLNNTRLQEILKAFKATEYDGILYLSQGLISAGKKASVDFYYRKTPSIGMEMYISQKLDSCLFYDKLEAAKVPIADIQSLETKVNLNKIDLENWPEKKEDITDVQRWVGYSAGFLIYLFIFMFGAQVMRGVLEEKTSRIVEVIISSVTPFQLMMGKILGIALIGLTQFVAWMILTFGISTFAQEILAPHRMAPTTEQVTSNNIMNSQTPNANVENVKNDQKDNSSEMLDGIFQKLRQVNFLLVIGAFLFYFIGGYLLYGSLFAAIGSAVDNETDTQQFMFPITIPLILGLFVMINTFLNPSGKLAIWFSIIPLTSPIVMMARIPFGVPVLQVLASVVLLVLTFLGTTWMAAKIYRTGILMYGKKVSYRELWKWLRYKG